MSRHTLPHGKTHRTGLRRWIFARYGFQPGWYAISAAIDQGMPCEPHPLLPGRIIFDLAAVEAWFSSREHEPVQRKPDKGTLIP